MKTHLRFRNFMKPTPVHPLNALSNRFSNFHLLIQGLMHRTPEYTNHIGFLSTGVRCIHIDRPPKALFMGRETHKWTEVCSGLSSALTKNQQISLAMTTAYLQPSACVNSTHISSYPFHLSSTWLPVKEC